MKPRATIRLGVLLSAFLVSCTEHVDVTAPDLAEDPMYAISDGARDGLAGFYWLPPLVEKPAFTGTFDPDLEPTVEICRWDEDGPDGPCVETVVEFSTTGDGAASATVRVDAEDEHYIVNWDTRSGEHELQTEATYRIRTLVDGLELGFADVDVVTSGRELQNVNTGEDIPLLDGRTLPIRFRIETGIVGNVAVEPAEATLEPGESLQYEANLTDLHGNPVSAPVQWSSSNPEVATIDADGRAVAAAEGASTITATSGVAVGSATLVVAAVADVDIHFASVSSGVAHSCALTADGQAFCWGAGFAGQLGTGSTDNAFTPAPVAGDLEFASISAGSRHTCGVTVSGEAYCWGDGTQAQLGTGSPGVELHPVPVAGGLAFQSVSAAETHTCGITTSGDPYCWGVGTNGELGAGSTEVALEPEPVLGDLELASISASFDHTCGLTTSGDAYCWGLGFSGRLGTGGTSAESEPRAVSGGHEFASIATGGGHTCAVTTSGEAYCWGLGVSGQLGTGSMDDELQPAAVAGDLELGSISGGGVHTCALSTSGGAFCWGFGLFGRLGTGSMDNELEPAAVEGGLEFVSLSAGDGHTCGATSSGEAFCWGHGGFGQLGTGSTDDELEPARVSFP